MSEHSILVTVCTYGRPDGLMALVESVVPQLAEGDGLLVVDNNPQGSPDLAASFASYPSVRVVREYRPGIPSARNRALAELTDEWAIVFVDDDEIADEGWLDAHRRFAARSDADVFFGPAVVTFPDGGHPSVVDGDILIRARHPTGQAMPFGPTNNTLVKRAALQRIGPIFFDEAFRESGGSDVDFFSRLRAQGASLVWNDEAVVTESIPATRATPEWVRARFNRLGHNRLALATSARATVLEVVKAVVRWAVGMASVLTSRGRLTSAGYGRIWVSRGVFSALLGRQHREYVRPHE